MLIPRNVGIRSNRRVLDCPISCHRKGGFGRFDHPQKAQIASFRMAEFSLSPLIPSRRWIEIEMATSWNFGGHLARLVVSVSSSHFGWLSPSVSSSTGCSPPRPFDCVHSQKRFPMCFHLTATLRIYTFCKLPYCGYPRFDNIFIRHNETVGALF